MPLTLGQPFFQPAGLPPPLPVPFDEQKSPSVTEVTPCENSQTNNQSVVVSAKSDVTHSQAIAAIALLEQNTQPPLDIIPAVLSFLDYRTVFTVIRRVNREWKQLTYTPDLTHQLEAQRWKEKCEQHFENRLDSLTRLLKKVPLPEEVKREEGHLAVQSPTEAKFSDDVIRLYARVHGQDEMSIDHFVLQYQQLKNHDLPRMVDSPDAMRVQFYKDMTAVQLREKLNGLIKMWRDFQQILTEKYPHHWKSLSEPVTTAIDMEKLPNAEGYQFIHAFMNQIAEIAGILSDIVIMWNIVQEILQTNQGEYFPQEAKGNFHLLDRARSRSSSLFDTITSRAMVLLANLKPFLFHYFTDIPSLHSHLKKLSKEDWVFMSYHNSLPRLQMLTEILNCPFINQQFTSRDYVDLAREAKHANTWLGADRVIQVLRNERAVTILTKNDLLSLLECYWKEIPAIYFNNPVFEKRMTFELWMELAEKSVQYDTVIAENSAIHKNFSPDQLVQLMKKHILTRKILLNQSDVISRLFQATPEQLAIIIMGHPSVENILLQYDQIINKLIELSPESLGKLLISCSVTGIQILLARKEVIEKIHGVLSQSEIRKLCNWVETMPSAAANAKMIRPKYEQDELYIPQSSSASHPTQNSISQLSGDDQAAYLTGKLFYAPTRVSRNWTTGRKAALGVLGILFITGLALTISGIGAAAGVNILFVTKSIAWYCFGAGIGDMLLAGFFAYNNYPPLVTHYKKVPIEQPVSSTASSQVSASQRKEEVTLQLQSHPEVKNESDLRKPPTPAWKKDSPKLQTPPLQKAPVNWTTLHKAAETSEVFTSSIPVVSNCDQQSSVSSLAEAKYQPGI